MAQAKKQIKNKLKLQVFGGQATPAPPLGPILGQNGIPLNEFVTQFNEKTRDRMGDELPVDVTVFQDNSFKMVIHEPTVASMVKKAANIAKGSATPNKQKVGSINMHQVEEIAKRKMPDLNTTNLESAKRIVLGSAKSLGIEIK